MNEHDTISVTKEDTAIQCGIALCDVELRHKETIVTQIALELTKHMIKCTASPDFANSKTVSEIIVEQFEKIFEESLKTSVKMYESVRRHSLT